MRTSLASPHALPVHHDEPRSGAPGVAQQRHRDRLVPPRTCANVSAPGSSACGLPTAGEGDRTCPPAGRTSACRRAPDADRPGRRANRPCRSTARRRRARRSWCGSARGFRRGEQRKREDGERIEGRGREEARASVQEPVLRARAVAPPSGDRRSSGESERRTTRLPADGGHHEPPEATAHRSGA